MIDTSAGDSFPQAYHAFSTSQTSCVLGLIALNSITQHPLFCFLLERVDSKALLIASETSKMSKVITGKQVVRELLSETVVSYIKCFAVVQTLRETSPFWASVVLGLLWVANGMTFTLNIGTIAEPIYQLYFFIANIVTNNRNKVMNEWGRILLDVAKIIFTIGAAIAGGVSSNWVSGSLLNPAFAFQNVHGNVAATFIVSTLVILIAQHAVLLPMTSNNDAHSTMIGIGAVTSAASVAIYFMTQGVLDTAVVIAIASALNMPGLGWLWAVLGALGIGALLTLVLYFLVWEDVFSSTAQLVKRQIQAEATLNGKASLESSDDEEMLVKSNKKHAHHYNAVSDM